MGNFQSLALRTTGFTSGDACLSIVAGTRRVRVLEIALYQATATVQTLGLGFPPTQGTATTPVLFQAEDGGVASLAAGHLTWSVQPGDPTIYLRRWNAPATIGSQCIWFFEHGLLIPAGQSLVIQNLSTAVATDVNISIYEE